MDIAIGIVIGVVLGIINALILRTGVRLACECDRRAKATLIIIASYAIRYALIAMAVYVILQKSTLTVAVTSLAAVGMMTILMAFIQRGRGPAGGRG